MEDKEYPSKCPRCGNTGKFYRGSVTRHGYQKWICAKCKKGFQLRYLRLEAVKGVQCPHCGSIDIGRRGISRGIRRYYCKTCKKTFQLNPKRPLPKPTKPKSKPDFLLASGSGIIGKRRFGLKTDRNETSNVRLIVLSGYPAFAVNSLSNAMKTTFPIAENLKSGCHV